MCGQCLLCGSEFLSKAWNAFWDEGLTGALMDWATDDFIILVSAPNVSVNGRCL